MITRPLDLASRLRPAPPGQDAIFFVNVAVLALFFTFFDSRFVLSPGQAIELPAVPDAVATARPADVVIAVRNADMVFADGGVMKLDGLGPWLAKQAKGRRGLTLLVLADAKLPVGDQAEIVRLAYEAGFAVHLAVQPLEKSAGAGR